MATHNFLRVPRFLAVLATAALLGSIGGIAYANQESGSAKPVYQANDAGETYGTLASATTSEEEPDLIAAAATNGKVGYVRKSELDEATGANVANPTEAVAWQARMDAAAAKGTQFYISVYESDGRTIIGEFMITPSSSVAGPK